MRAILCIASASPEREGPLGAEITSDSSPEHFRHAAAPAGFGVWQAGQSIWGSGGRF